MLRQISMLLIHSFILIGIFKLGDTSRQIQPVKIQYNFPIIIIWKYIKVIFPETISHQILYILVFHAHSDLSSNPLIETALGLKQSGSLCILVTLKKILYSFLLFLYNFFTLPIFSQIYIFPNYTIHNRCLRLIKFITLSQNTASVVQDSKSKNWFVSIRWKQSNVKPTSKRSHEI